MQWKTPERIKHGQTDVRKYFALLPTELDDGNTVWLEFYYSEEVWIEMNAEYAMSHWKSVRTYSQKTNENRINKVE